MQAHRGCAGGERGGEGTVCVRRNRLGLHWPYSRTRSRRNSLCAGSKPQRAKVVAGSADQTFLCAAHIGCAPVSLREWGADAKMWCALGQRSLRNNKKGGLTAFQMFSFDGVHPLRVCGECGALVSVPDHQRGNDGRSALPHCERRRHQGLRRRVPPAAEPAG